MSHFVASLLAIYILTGVILTSAVPTVQVLPTNHSTPTEPVPRECREFSAVTEDQNGHVEFYSPGYPGNYSNNLECVLKIVAEFGYQINVDFRDYFNLEPSEKCENDFLEIRDGPHGYSDLLGKFCGKSFPPKITSKGRYLWLRFSSDDSLKYEGFRAVYEVFKNPNIIREEVPPCHFVQSGFQGLISEKNISQFQLNYSITYSLPIDCTWRLEVDPNKKIYLFFDLFKLHKPNECDQNYVDIFEGKRDMNSRKKHYCGSVADPVVSTGNLMFFRYFAIRATIQSEFTAYFTAFREKEAGPTKPTKLSKKLHKDEEAEEGADECFKNEYDCDDATCIDASLRCNGIRNCRHMYDEEDCKDSSSDEFDISSQHIVVILTLGCGLLAGMCFAMCFNCIKKLVRDGKQIHENIRRSREQLEGKRTASMASFPRNITNPDDGEGDVPCFMEGKSNGRPCFHGEDDEAETDEDDDDDDEMEDTEIEMRDCECQTRDTMIRANPIQPGTPPPPPPPMRRPPDVPPCGFTVPTPPPPPASHYARHPAEPTYPYVPENPHHYEGNDTLNKYKQRYRSETLIHMKEALKAESPRTGKATPDVLAMH